MLCNNCKDNRASYHFLVNWMGYVSEVYLCSGCVEQLRRRWMPGYRVDLGHLAAALDASLITGEGSFPADAGKQIKLRRRLGELKARLERAVEREDYELAAKLRDEIKESEKGVCYS